MLFMEEEVSEDRYVDPPAIGEREEEEIEDVMFLEDSEDTEEMIPITRQEELNPPPPPMNDELNIVDSDIQLEEELDMEDLR